MTESLPSRFDILLPLDHDFSVILFSLNHTPSTFNLIPFYFQYPASSIQYRVSSIRSAATLFLQLKKFSDQVNLV